MKKYLMRNNEIIRFLIERCGNMVTLEWVGHDLFAAGPKGERLYRQSCRLRDYDRVAEGEFYLQKVETEYDLLILADQIIGDLVQPIPEVIKSGHAVVIDQLDQENIWSNWPELKSRVAIVTRTGFETAQTAGLVFTNSGHRGYGVRHSYDSSEAFTSLSGGPCPHAVPTKEFYFSGQYRRLNFWRWRDGAIAHGGEYYSLQVPLWYWRSESLGAAA
jgi:hypothetical protein